MSPFAVVLVLSTGSFLLGLLASVATLRSRFLAARRIQRRPRARDVLREHLPLILLNFGLVELGVILGFPTLEERFLVDTDRSLAWVAAQFLVVYLLDDLYQYWAHRAMHEVKPIFRLVHRIHHRAKEPFPLDYLYVHPLENAIGSLGVVLVMLVMGPLEVRTFYLWVLAKNLHLAVLHSGIRSSGFRLVPFLSHSEHHERHHSGPGFRCNYAQNFTYLDRLFGTDDPASRRSSVLGSLRRSAIRRLRALAPSMERRA